MTSPLEAYLREFPQYRSRDRGELVQELYQTGGLEVKYEEFVGKLLRDPEDPTAAGKLLKQGAVPDHPPRPPSQLSVGIEQGLVGGLAKTIEAITPAPLPEEKQRVLNRYGFTSPQDEMRDYTRRLKKSITPDEAPQSTAEYAKNIVGRGIGSAPWMLFDWQRGYLWWALLGRREAEKNAEEHPNRQTTGIPVPFADEEGGFRIPFTKYRLFKDWPMPIMGKDIIPSITPKSWHDIPEGGGATTWEQFRDAFVNGGLRAYLGWVSTRLYAQRSFLQGAQFAGGQGMADIALGRDFEDQVIDVAGSFMLAAGLNRLSPAIEEKVKKAMMAQKDNPTMGGAMWNEIFQEPGVSEHLARAAYLQHSKDAEEAITHAQAQVKSNQKEIERLANDRTRGGNLDAIMGLREENRILDDELYVLYGVTKERPPEAYGLTQKDRFAAMRDSEAALASQIAIMQKRWSEYQEFFTEAELTFKGVDDLERKNVLTAIMRGGEVPDKYKPVVNKFREIFDDIYATDKDAAIKYTYLTDYWPLMWKAKNQEGATALASKMAARPNFSKEKVFDDPFEGEAAGFQLRTTNPAVMAVWRIEASLRAQAKRQSLQMFEDMGLAIKEQRIPYQPKPDDAGPNWTPSVPPQFRGWESYPVGGQIYRMHPNAMRYLKRAFDEDYKALTDWFNLDAKFVRPAESIGKAWLAVRNTTIPTLLALSAFHSKHVLDIAMVQFFVPAMSAKLSGRMSFSDFMKVAKNADVLGAYGAGRNAMANFGRPMSELSQVEKNDQLIMLMGGYNPRRPEIYHVHTEQTIRRAWNDQIATLKQQWDKGGKDQVAAALGLPPAYAQVLFAQTAKFITLQQEALFADWIPAMKTEAYLNEAKTRLATKPELLKPGNEKDLRAEMTDVRVRMDERFGEMQYEKWFVNNAMKRVLFATMLSVGWNWGFWRSHGGALMETAGYRARGLNIQPMEEREFTTRMAYVSMYTSWALLQGSLATYMMTGRLQGMDDMIFPRMPDGSQVTTPFFTKVIAEIYHHTRMHGLEGGALQLAHNKLNPAASAFLDLMKNEDWRGFEIYDPQADVFTRLKQVGAYMAVHTMPISVQTSLQDLSSPGRVGMNFFGFNKAPEYIKASDAEAFIQRTYDKYHPAEKQPYAEARKRETRTEIGRAYKQARDAKDPGTKAAFERLYGKLREEYMSKYGREYADIEKGLSMTKKFWDGPRFSFAFQKLSVQQQGEALNMMEEEQRQQYLPFAHVVVRDGFNYKVRSKNEPVSKEFQDWTPSWERKSQPPPNVPQNQSDEFQRPR